MGSVFEYHITYLLDNYGSAQIFGDVVNGSDVRVAFYYHNYHIHTAL